MFLINCNSSTDPSDAKRLFVLRSHDYLALGLLSSNSSLSFPKGKVSQVEVNFLPFHFVWAGIGIPYTYHGDRFPGWEGLLLPISAAWFTVFLSLSMVLVLEALEKILNWDKMCNYCC